MFTRLVPVGALLLVLVVSSCGQPVSFGVARTPILGGPGQPTATGGTSEPAATGVAHLFAKIRYHERPKFMLFDQRDNGYRAPISDGVEVDAEVASPSAGHRIRLMFAGTEGDADPTLPVLCLGLSNHQWVNEAGSHWR